MTMIFKAYDIRGSYPEEINEETAFKIGQAYVKVIKPSGVVAVARDVRIHSEKLSEALIQGIRETGIDVLDIGLASTETLYFTVGQYKLAGGIQVTASHDDAQYNGFKMVREEVIPLSSETGIFEIRDLIDEKKETSSRKGERDKKDVSQEYVEYLLKRTGEIKPLKLAYNPSFGYQGVLLEKIKKQGNLPLTLFGLNYLPDGTFPKGKPDPFLKENRQEFIDFTKDSKADLGVAWDADGDRVFFCTKKGIFVEPYFLNALLIKHIAKEGDKIIYDPRYVWALKDSAQEKKAQAFLERVGHSFIKERMRQEKAVFAGESSGHTYFKDFWYSDSGLLPLLIILEILSQGYDLDELLRPLFEKYFISGEINFKVENNQKTINSLKKKYRQAQTSEKDGFSWEFPDWRANVRSSNTSETVLRVNIEGKSREIVQEKTEEVEKIILDPSSS
jgi:phosphomannomutase